MFLEKVEKKEQIEYNKCIKFIELMEAYDEIKKSNNNFNYFITIL